jgi:hypothetical protein
MISKTLCTRFTRAMLATALIGVLMPCALGQDVPRAGRYSGTLDVLTTVIPDFLTVKTTVKIAARVKDNAVDIIAQPLVSADLEGLEHYNFFRYDPAHGGVFTANSDTPRQVIAVTVKESSLVLVLLTGPDNVGNSFSGEVLAERRFTFRLTRVGQ